MAGDALTRRDHGKTIGLVTTVSHILHLQPFKGFIIEVEDVHFHHDSAVFLADYGAFEKPVDEDSERVVGLSALCACYKQAQSHPDQKLLIAGHTDTTGTPDYNFPLSQKRADNILAVLMGDRAGWVKICLGQHKVKDYQQILKWVAYVWSWPCDPGDVDDVQGPLTRDATKEFQKQYNIEYEKSIDEDGVVGEQTWGAFFDVYIDVLKELLDTDDAGLAKLRSGLNFVDGGKKTVGCGEEFPIEQPRKQEYRSQINRRTELLFFEAGQEPKLDCHPAPKKCTPLLCEIYNPKMYKFTHIPVPPTKYKRKYRITLEYGDIDALFTDIAANTHTDPGVRERMQALGFLYEPLNSANIGQVAQDAFDHFKNKIVKQASDAAAVAQLKPLLQNTVLDQNRLPATGAFAMIRFPGTYCLTDAQDNAGFFGNPAAAGAFSYRYQSETDVWGHNPSIGLLPIVATVEFQRGSNFRPAGAGRKVHFQLIKPDDIPAGSAVAATPLGAAAFSSTNKNKHPPPATLTFNMTGSPQKYVTTEKARNAVVPDDPQVDNAHQTVGGKRGNDVAGTDKLKNVLEITNNHTGFHDKFNLNEADTSDHPNAAVAETNDDSKAGVILMPAWTGGDRYKIRAFLDPVNGVAFDGTEPDAAKAETGTMVVWRILRISKYLRWPYQAGASAADQTNSRGALPTFNITGFVAAEYKKSWFDVTVEDDAKAPQNISQADWQSAMIAAKTTVIANVAAGTVALTQAYDVAALVPHTSATAGVNNPSVGFMNFLTAAQYDAAAKGAAPPGGWPTAAGDANYWANMRRLFHAIKNEMIAWFTKNAISGLTIIQSPVMCSLSNPRTLAGRPGTPWRNSGWGTSKRGCYVVFGQDFYGGPNASLAYDHDHNTLHETGHVLFGVHQYTDTNEVNSSMGGIFDEHDYHDLCIMGYMACAGGFCGRCVLNQSGWNTRPIPANSPGP